MSKKEKAQINLDQATSIHSQIAPANEELQSLPEFEQKIVFSFLERLASREKYQASHVEHKFFDPLAGP